MYKQEIKLNNEKYTTKHNVKWGPRDATKENYKLYKHLTIHETKQKYKSEMQIKENSI